jgi:hypothetical protein
MWEWVDDSVRTEVNSEQMGKAFQRVMSLATSFQQCVHSRQLSLISEKSLKHFKRFICYHSYRAIILGM